MDRENLLTKFDEMAKRYNEIIEEERAKMKAEVELYNDEKQRMKAIEVSDDDIIRLNVGGQKFTTKRSTLCQVEGSLLASMFSGRWEDGLVRDQDGRIFFDFHPQYFDFILQYLRAKKIATLDNPALLPKVPEDRVKNFKSLVEYLGLSDEIFPCEILPISEIFTSHSPGITLAEGGKVAVHDSTSGQKYILDKKVYKGGMVRFKLKLDYFQSSNWLFVGIVKGDVVPTNDNSQGWPGSYGWALGAGYQWKNGSTEVITFLENRSKQGDTVELVLDCDSAKLLLLLPTGQQFNIEIPKSQTWRLHVNLHGANNKICIVDTY